MSGAVRGAWVPHCHTGGNQTWVPLSCCWCWLFTVFSTSRLGQTWVLSMLMGALGRIPLSYVRMKVKKQFPLLFSVHFVSDVSWENPKLNRPVVDLQLFQMEAGRSKATLEFNGEWDRVFVYMCTCAHAWEVLLVWIIKFFWIRIDGLVFTLLDRHVVHPHCFSSRGRTKQEQVRQVHYPQASQVWVSWWLFCLIFFFFFFLENVSMHVLWFW